MLLIEKKITWLSMKINKRVYGLRTETKIKQIREIINIFNTNIINTKPNKRYQMVYRLLYNSVNDVLNKPDSKTITSETISIYKEIISHMNFVERTEEKEEFTNYKALYFVLYTGLVLILKLEQEKE